MPADLPVHVNRDELHSLEIQPSLEAHGSFDVRLVNHGESVHVHLHLDDGLSQVASIDASNHYVEGETARAVRVAVDEAALGEDPLRGKLKVAVGYGAETRWIDVELAEPTDDDTEVTVDESLTTPPPTTEEPEPSVLQRPEVPVLALGVVALAVALVAALVLNETIVLVGALVVLAGVVVALYFLSRPEHGI